MRDDDRVVLFPKYPDQRHLPGSDPRERQKVLVLAYRYIWTHDDVKRRITAPAGFIHNGASVPGIFRSFFAPEPLDKSATIHDLIHRYCGRLPYGAYEIERAPDDWVDALEHPDGRLSWSRRAGDKLMMRMMREDPTGPRRWKRRAGFRFLRQWGWVAWDCEEEEEDEGS